VAYCRIEHKAVEAIGLKQASEELQTEPKAVTEDLPTIPGMLENFGVLLHTHLSGPAAWRI